MKIKRFFVIILVMIFLLTLLGCGQNKVIDGKERKTVGIVSILVNDPTLFEVKDPTIRYEIIWGNVIWGVVLCETVIVPIYFFGFSIFNPIEKIK